MIFFVKLAAILTAITRWFDVGEAQCAGNSDVIVENGPCSYSIHATASFFTDVTFSIRRTLPLRVLSGDFVYLGVHLDNTSKPTNHLLLETCWATKKQNSLVPNITNRIVDFPGCPSRTWRNVITLNNNGQSSDVTIRFPIFFLFPEVQEFYLHCSVGACEACQPRGCDSVAQVKQTFTRTAGVVSIGPVQRTDFVPKDKLTEYTTSFLIAACVLAGVALIVVVCILIYYMRSSKLKRYVQNLPPKEPSAPVLISTTRITSCSETNGYPTPSEPTSANGNDAVSGEAKESRVERAV